MADLLAEGFVVQDACRFTVLPTVVILEGTIECLDGIVLDVRKEIQVLEGTGPTARVQTRAFRYHAWVRGTHNIVRYESPHEHRRYAHKHEYDTFGTGVERAVTDLKKEDDVPTLSEVLRELQAWHEQNGARLKDLR